MSSGGLSLGARVSVAAGTGCVRFIGATSFAAGKWVGIELDVAGSGKNDGTVQGKAYFELEKAGSTSGVFVRPSQVHLLDEQDAQDAQDDEQVFAVPAPPKPRPSSSATTAPTRPAGPPATPSASTSRRPLSGRPSAAASPAPSPRPSLSRLTSSTSGSGASTPARTAVAARPSAVGLTPRAPSSSSTTSSAPASRRESTNSAASARPSLATPRRPLAASNTTGAETSSSALPRPSSVASNASTSALPRARPITPRSEKTALPLPTPSSSGMQRGTSSSSAASSVSAATAEKSARLQALQQKTRMRGTTSGVQDTSPSAQTELSHEQHDSPQSPHEGDEVEGPASPLQASLQRKASRQAAADEDSRFSLQPAAAISSASAVPPDKAPSVPLRMYEELTTRLRLLESGRSEDRERLKDYERLKEEHDSYALARPKLQAKLVELAGECKDLRRQLRDAEARTEEERRKAEEAEEKLEMEALDKEMAEEKLEQETAKLDLEKERVAQLEVELDVLRKEEARIVSEAKGGLSTEGTGGDPESEKKDGKDSLAFIQLAKQNERLKEALMRLRDLSNENEVESRRRISDLEKELDLTADMQATFDATVEQLEAAEALVENLKLQLDDAMGAEDMLEHLTERNLSLSERIEEMHAVIQDLEALKELNDELEENHTENERQMQEEIDLKDHQMQDLRRQVGLLEDGILDYEGTISQFRELVLSLQGDIESLREQHATQQSAASDLSGQSQAMLNLNMKLQSTVLRNQSKVVDFELRKHEALQARQQLSIITPYLPAAFFEDDKGAVDALLFFSRLAAKTDILLRAIEATHGLADGAFPDAIPDSLVRVCEARTKIARFSVLCKRFSVNLARCDAPTWIKMGKVYLELSGVEKRLDAYIDLAKKEELKEAECGIEVERFTAQAAHVAENYLGESGLDFGEQQLGVISSVDLDLDTLVAGVGYAKQALALLTRDKDVVLELGDQDLDEAVFACLQAIIEAARANKVLSKKLLRRIEEVIRTGGSLRPEVVDPTEAVSGAVRSAAAFGSKLAELVLHYVQEVRTSKEPFQLSTFFGIITESAVSLKSQHKDLLGVEVVLRNLQQALQPATVSAADPENAVHSSWEAPWELRVREMRAALAKDTEAELKVVKLTEDVRDLSRSLRTKDQAIQEASVKIEHMERRMESVKKQAEAITELEAEVARASAAEREAEKSIEQLQADLDALERENVKLKSAAPAEKALGAAGFDTGEYTTFTGSLETSHLVSQIESLRGTVRYLRSQNSFLRSQDLLADLSSLPTYETATHPSEENARIIKEESAALFRQVAEMSSRAKVVDLSKIETGKAWNRMEDRPKIQLERKRAQLEILKKKVDRLADKKVELLGR